MPSATIQATPPADMARGAHILLVGHPSTDYTNWPRLIGAPLGVDCDAVAGLSDGQLAAAIRVAAQHALSSDSLEASFDPAGAEAWLRVQVALVRASCAAHAVQPPGGAKAQPASPVSAINAAATVAKAAPAWQPSHAYTARAKPSGQPVAVPVLPGAPMAQPARPVAVLPAAPLARPAVVAALPSADAGPGVRSPSLQSVPAAEWQAGARLVASDIGVPAHDLTRDSRVVGAPLGVTCAEYAALGEDARIERIYGVLINALDGGPRGHFDPHYLQAWFRFQLDANASLCRPAQAVQPPGGAAARPPPTYGVAVSKSSLRRPTGKVSETVRRGGPSAMKWGAAGARADARPTAQVDNSRVLAARGALVPGLKRAAIDVFSQPASVTRPGDVAGIVGPIVSQPASVTVPDYARPKSPVASPSAAKWSLAGNRDPGGAKAKPTAQVLALAAHADPYADGLIDGLVLRNGRPVARRDAAQMVMDLGYDCDSWRSRPLVERAARAQDWVDQRMGLAGLLPPGWDSLRMARQLMAVADRICGGYVYATVPVDLWLFRDRVWGGPRYGFPVRRGLPHGTWHGSPPPGQPNPLASGPSAPSAPAPAHASPALAHPTGQLLNRDDALLQRLGMSCYGWHALGQKEKFLAVKKYGAFGQRVADIDRLCAGSIAYARATGCPTCNGTCGAADDDDDHMDAPHQAPARPTGCPACDGTCHEATAGLAATPLTANVRGGRVGLGPAPVTRVAGGRVVPVNTQYLGLADNGKRTGQVDNSRPKDPFAGPTASSVDVFAVLSSAGITPDGWQRMSGAARKAALAKLFPGAKNLALVSDAVDRLVPGLK